MKDTYLYALLAVIFVVLLWAVMRQPKVTAPPIQYTVIRDGGGYGGGSGGGGGYYGEDAYKNPAAWGAFIGSLGGFDIGIG